LKRLKEIIESGILGNVFLIENREFYDGGRTYMGRWNRHYDVSGGLWIHKGSHDFDVFNWLLGFPRPVRVSAVAGVNALNPEGVPFPLKDGVQPGPDCTACAYADTCPDAYRVEDHEIGRKMWGKEARGEDNYAKNACIYLSDKSVHDNGIAIVEYENGAKASHLECFVCSFSDRMYTVVGDRGIAEVSLHRREITVHPRWKTGETLTYRIPAVSGSHGGADPVLVETFMNVLKGKEPNATTAEQGLWATAIGQAAEIAWREKRSVLVDEIM
jgi:predicted dehydrogenase